MAINIVPKSLGERLKDINDAGERARREQDELIAIQAAFIEFEKHIQGLMPTAMEAIRGTVETEVRYRTKAVKATLRLMNELVETLNDELVRQGQGLVCIPETPYSYMLKEKSGV